MRDLIFAVIFLSFFSEGLKAGEIPASDIAGYSYKSTVLIKTKGTPCSGALLESGKVLTAKHCIEENDQLEGIKVMIPKVGEYDVTGVYRKGGEIQYGDGFRKKIISLETKLKDKTASKEELYETYKKLVRENWVMVDISSPPEDLYEVIKFNLSKDFGASEEEIVFTGFEKRGEEYVPVYQSDCDIQKAGERREFSGEGTCRLGEIGMGGPIFTVKVRQKDEHILTYPNSGSDLHPARYELFLLGIQNVDIADDLILKKGDEKTPPGYIAGIWDSGEGKKDVFVKNHRVLVTDADSFYPGEDITREDFLKACASSSEEKEESFSNFKYRNYEEVPSNLWQNPHFIRLIPCLGTNDSRFRKRFFKNFLESPDERLLRANAKALEEMYDEDSKIYEDLEKILLEGKFHARWRIVELLGNIGLKRSSAYKTIAEVLTKDKDPEVRYWSAYVLEDDRYIWSEFKDKALGRGYIFEALFQSLEDESFKVTQMSAKTLRKTISDESLARSGFYEVLLNKIPFEERPAEVKEKIIPLLRSSEDPKIQEKIMDILLNDESEDVKMEAIRSLKEMTLLNKEIQKLESALVKVGTGEGSIELRALALKSLHKIFKKDSRYLPTLLDLIARDKDPQIQRRVCESLGVAAESPQVQKAIAEALIGSSSRDTHKACAYSLNPKAQGNMRPTDYALDPEVERILVEEGLTSPQRGVRGNSLKVLIGNKISYEDRRVQEEVAKILAKEITEGDKEKDPPSREVRESRDNWYSIGTVSYMSSEDVMDLSSYFLKDKPHSPSIRKSLLKIFYETEDEKIKDRILYTLIPEYFSTYQISLMDVIAYSQEDEDFRRLNEILKKTVEENRSLLESGEKDIISFLREEKKSEIMETLLKTLKKEEKEELQASALKNLVRFAPEDPQTLKALVDFALSKDESEVKKMGKTLLKKGEQNETSEYLKNPKIQKYLLDAFNSGENKKDAALLLSQTKHIFHVKDTLLEIVREDTNGQDSYQIMTFLKKYGVKDAKFGKAFLEVVKRIDYRWSYILDDLIHITPLTPQVEETFLDMLVNEEDEERRDHMILIFSTLKPRNHKTQKVIVDTSIENHNQHLNHILSNLEPDYPGFSEQVVEILLSGSKEEDQDLITDSIPEMIIKFIKSDGGKKQRENLEVLKAAATYFVRKGNVDAADILLRANSKDPRILKILEDNLDKYKVPEIVKFLTEESKCLELCDPYFYKKASLEEVQDLIQKGQDVNGRDKRGRTPLIALLQSSKVNFFEAAHYRNSWFGEHAWEKNPQLKKIFDLFISEGADIHYKHGDINALHYATLGEAGVDIIKTLVEEHGFDIHEHAGKFNTDPLNLISSVVYAKYPYEVIESPRRKRIEAACRIYNYLVEKGARPPSDFAIEGGPAFRYYILEPDIFPRSFMSHVGPETEFMCPLL